MNVGVVWVTSLGMLGEERERGKEEWRDKEVRERGR
jgi:hypothetical protein